jgi:hypothetical protein
MRRVLAVALLLLACGARAETRDEALSREIQQRIGRPLRTIECPSAEWWKPGTTITCTAWLKDDGPWVVEVDVIDAEHATVRSVQEYVPPPDTTPPAVREAATRQMRIYAGTAIGIFAILLLGGATGLFTLIGRSLIDRPREVVEQQPIFFGTPGKYLIWADSPRWVREMRGVQAWLWDPRAARWLEMRPYLPMRFAGVSRVRHPIASYRIDEPGEYFLQLRGLVPAKPYASQLLIGRDTSVRQVASMVAAMLGLFGLIVSLLVFANA